MSLEFLGFHRDSLTIIGRNRILKANSWCFSFALWRDFLNRIVAHDFYSIIQRAFHAAIFRSPELCAFVRVRFAFEIEPKVPSQRKRLPELLLLLGISFFLIPNRAKATQDVLLKGNILHIACFCRLESIILHWKDCQNASNLESQFQDFESFLVPNPKDSLYWINKLMDN